LKKKERRRELAVFTMNQSAEAVYKMLAYRGYLPLIKSGDVLVFMAATALLSYFYKYEPQSLGNIKGVLTFVFGDSPTPTQASTNPQSLCTHKDPSCVTSTIKSTIRGFLLGFGARGSLSFLSGLVFKRMYKTPRKLLELSLGKETMRFGLFVGSLVGLWKGIDCFLRNIRVHDDQINSIVAGVIAGLSILFSRSSELSMYVFSKAIEALVLSLVKRGILKSIPNMDVILFAIGTGIVFYSCCLEPFNLRPSYWRFMRSVSGSRFDQFETIAKVYQSIGFLRTGFRYPLGITESKS